MEKMVVSITKDTKAAFHWIESKIDDLEIDHNIVSASKVFVYTTAM